MSELDDIISKIEVETLSNFGYVKENIKTIPEGKINTLVDYLQDWNNKLYEQYGLTDGILDLQVFINELRCEYDITDPKEIVNVDDNMEFVQ